MGCEIDCASTDVKVDARDRTANAAGENDGVMM